MTCVMAACAWWVHHTQQAALDAGRAAQTRAAGDLLAETAEVLLAQDDLSAARRLLADTARVQEFGVCRIVLPDGQIAARGRVSRAGTSYTATVTDGALAQWCVEVDGQRSAVQDGSTVSFDAAA